MGSFVHFSGSIGLVCRWPVVSSFTFTLIYPLFSFPCFIGAESVSGRAFRFTTVMVRTLAVKTLKVFAVANTCYGVFARALLVVFLRLVGSSAPEAPD